MASNSGLSYSSTRMTTLRPVRSHARVMTFSNRVDSTYADGSISTANDAGGDWEILSLRLGLVKSRGEEPAVWHNVLFGGRETTW